METAKFLETIGVVGSWLMIVICVGLVIWRAVYAAMELRRAGKAEQMAWAKVIAGLFIIGYVVYCVHSTMDRSYAPILHKCVAAVAIFVWAIWTIYTIDEKRKGQENNEKDRE